MRNNTKMRAFALSAFILTASGSHSLGAEERGDSIVREMDARMNFTSCRMTILIQDEKSGGRTRSLRARVEYLDKAGTRIEFFEPARDKGKRILMAGDSMWMASPGVSKAVRLSGKDSFMGTSFTNDDAMNFDRSDDYDAMVASEDDEGWDIVLTARRAALPYPRIEARIGKDCLPIVMTFFTRSGKASKRIEYSAVRRFGERSRPSVMEVTDLMTESSVSRIVFEEIIEGKVDASRFTASALER